MRYRASTGQLILVGKGNLQNDTLTIKTARGKDVWFHVQDAPGSHTVVMSEGQDVPIEALNEAAHIAVYHSSLKGGAKVPVDYTPVRNVKKPAGAKPGMVIYEHYETAYITLDEALVQKLAENDELA
ncbi:NFACT RNA binding domain-containing protein [Ruminococcaceae bacterium OttesenSCG-928-N02]|nr:NFACT RNA binding domain-containing protein [Ruminococcaceae bacterium OttesenSCG-928-N02]